MNKRDIDLHKRATLLRAMDTIARSLNNEEWFYDTWLLAGVPDGEIQEDTTDEDLEWLCEDYQFQPIMATFCRLMRCATNDEEFEEKDLIRGNGILYCDGVISKYDD